MNIIDCKLLLCVFTIITHVNINKLFVINIKGMTRKWIFNTVSLATGTLFTLKVLIIPNHYYYIF